jgi:hypothetical protein
MTPHSLDPASLLPHDIVRVQLPGRPQPTAARLLLAIPGEHRAIIEHPYPPKGIVEVTSVPFPAISAVQRWLPVQAPAPHP